MAGEAMRQTAAARSDPGVCPTGSARLRRTVEFRVIWRSLNLDGCSAVSDLEPLVRCTQLTNSVRLYGQTLDASSLCNVISACSPELHINVKDCVFPFSGFPWRSGGTAALLETLADPHTGERVDIRSCEIGLAPRNTLYFGNRIDDEEYDENCYYDFTTDEDEY
jgi:hypothetical protein